MPLTFHVSRYEKTPSAPTVAALTGDAACDTRKRQETLRIDRHPTTGAPSVGTVIDASEGRGDVLACSARMVIEHSLELPFGFDIDVVGLAGTCRRLLLVQNGGVGGARSQSLAFRQEAQLRHAEEVPIIVDARNDIVSLRTGHD